MLTGDPFEAMEQARAYLKEGTLMAYYKEILIGALRLAQADAEQGRLARLENIFKTVSDLVEDLAEHGDDDTTPGEKGRGRSCVGSQGGPVGAWQFWGKAVFLFARIGPARRLRGSDCREGTQAQGH
jgi:hypothetical protein